MLGNRIKILAMIVMVIDHMGEILFPELIWMRIIGRMAFPIFAFFIAEGFAHTRNIKKYIARMAVFGVVSEIAFDIAICGGPGTEHQNVMFTFLLALIGLYALDKIGGIGGLILMVLMGVLAEFLRTDYGMFGVMLVYVYYLMRGEYGKKHILASAFMLLADNPIQRYAVFATIPLLFYNGKKGTNKLKYLFYAFYPVHLILLWFIGQYII